MDEVAAFAWDDLKRELVAVLAAVVYLAAIRLIQRYKAVLDRWLKPTAPAPRKPPQEEDEEAEGVFDDWLGPPMDDPPDTR